MSANQNKQFQFKLVLLGEAAVGKSSLVLRFVKGHFTEHQESTIGAAFMTQTLALDDVTVKFEIWDTAGQERYHSLAPMYYRGAQAAVVVYDITSTDSFERAQRWVSELRDQANKNIVIALAGNKIDLCNDLNDGENSSPIDDETISTPLSKRSVSKEEAEAYCKDNKLIFFETSAKTGECVHDVFLSIAHALPKSVEGSNQRGRQVNLDGTEGDGEKTKCC